MSDVTQILSEIEHGDPAAAEQLLPLVYDELRKLAAAKLASEKPGQTLQATALVHEAYLRLVDVEKVQHWDSPRPFLCRGGRSDAADPRGKCSPQRTQKTRRRFEARGTAMTRTWRRPPSDEHLLAIDEALDSLAAERPSGRRTGQAAILCGILGIRGGSKSSECLAQTAYAQWAYARAWLRCEVEDRD